MHSHDTRHDDGPGTTQALGANVSRLTLALQTRVHADSANSLDTGEAAVWKRYKLELQDVKAYKEAYAA